MSLDFMLDDLVVKYMNNSLACLLLHGIFFCDYSLFHKSAD